VAVFDTAAMADDSPSPPSGTALVSFHLLPEIQHVQPEELDASEDPYIEYKSPHTTAAELSKYEPQEFKSPASMKSELKSLETGSMSSWLPPQLPANGKRRQVSSAFQTLLDQLAQQHVRELNESAKKTKVSARTGTKDSFTSTAPVDQKSSLRSRKSAGSEMMATTSLRRHNGATASTTTQELLMRARNRQNIPAVQADQIAVAFTPEGTASLGRVASDLGSKFSDVDADETMLTEFFSESESAFRKRFKNLSWFSKAQWWLQSNQFEMLISAALCVNIFWMAFELQIEGAVIGFRLGTYSEPLIQPVEYAKWESAMKFIDLLFALFFGLEVILRVLVLGVAFWKSWLNYIDMAVSIISVIEMFVFMSPWLGVNPVLFRLLRMGKLSRAMRVVSMTSVLASLQLLLKCLAASRDMLFWSFLLLTFVQCVAGMIVTTLCWEFIKDENQDAKLREDVFRYYGTFTRTFLSMFEIMFANWSPPCRVLVEHVSEWFSIFFLLYRCVLGFAVLNVVNAVFVQQTMKTASSDEDIAFKQREKDIAQYNRKVKKLFATMDSSGDGAINFEEFSKLVKSPKLRFWMSQLELEYHDLLSLFEFLDNGDGNITLHEFIDGAARLRGSAKSLDVWRMETKVEVLFEEVLTYLDELRAKDAAEAAAKDPNSPTTSPKHSSIQDIFNQSAFRHIKATTFREDGAASEEMEDKSVAPVTSKSAVHHTVTAPG